MASKLSERDLHVLVAIGRFRMLTRPQVKRWFFADVSEPVVTRFVKRVESAGFVGIERVGGNGMQLLWLTRKGRDFLVGRGACGVDIFPAVGPAAPKDFAHTVAIGDVAAWLVRRDPPPDEVLPAWAMQRYFGGALGVIPDLLALWRPAPARLGAALSVEVDLGTEPLKSVFLPKLLKLDETIRAWFPETENCVLVLVPSQRRAESLRTAAGDSSVRFMIHTFEETIQPVLTSP